MPHPTDLYDLLVAFGFDSEEYSGFHLIWAEGIGANELCRRLGGDPSSAFRCDIDNLKRPEAQKGPAMWAGSTKDWTQALLFNLPTSPLSFLTRVSRGTRALSIKCGYDNYRLDWAVDGILVTCFAINWPDARGGTDPHSLDALMEDLAFQLDDPDDDATENPVTIEVSVTSALELAGRITGRRLDTKWLSAVHSNYSLQSN
ncbi:hypothetical protein FXF51_41155 [Nonomuraea sp. PA05]|uniref:DUF6461 domain-containing protein n=1 Tax=Nonomuraea sp. PA05 TaxID=2604466 RepID=UPI0011D701EE|nr:DUF6461 domain-containing protein [Nonomuraea sp. PA05]TYB57233.1 hypothetical protein FXF51_41155 [Nonomuraea sp. PA05]